MADKNELRRAYYRGYRAAQRGSWPEHHPPMPPQPYLTALMESARKLRDDAASGCATFDPDDEFVKLVYPSIEEMDAALETLTRWLKEEPANG